ncbi:MAG: nucleoid-associated protein [Bacteroidales bacterium]|nr:nucleoid-associated protein [Bacteroidales bacterium]
MLDFSQTQIEKLSVHNVGNKTNGETLQLSKSLLDIAETNTRELLLKFFLPPFSSPEYYSFTFSNGDCSMNPLYIFASAIFDDLKTFHENSINIAQHLFETSTHPQIKPGDLFVAYLDSITIEDETVDAIGIFKSENRQSFLKVNNQHDQFSIQGENGISIEKLDKGCLIFNTDRDTGYRVCIVDKSNKLTEAQYWKDTFLQLKPLSDEFHSTKEFMNITRNFVTNRLTQDFEVGRTDQIDMLNRSVEYFKKNENFSKTDFEQHVLGQPEVIDSFRNFESAYKSENNIELPDNFEISPQAVKKQARIFKSVLKLDRNFHIYIHGNRELIEKGVDENGRKFYKIYYNEEN